MVNNVKKIYEKYRLKEHHDPHIKNMLEDLKNSVDDMLYWFEKDDYEMIKKETDIVEDISDNLSRYIIGLDEE